MSHYLCNNFAIFSLSFYFECQYIYIKKLILYCHFELFKTTELVFFTQYCRSNFVLVFLIRYLWLKCKADILVLHSTIFEQEIIE